MTADKATNDDTRDGLKWIQYQTTSKDVAILFLSGHGMNDYYFAS